MGTAGELVTVAAGDDAGKVRVITLDRPDKLNAFNTALYNAAGDALQAAADDDGVSVVVLTGNGRAFSAGQDLHEMAAQAAGTAPAANPTAAPADGPSGFPRFVDALQAFPKPVVAAVNGLAVGIGFTLLPHCDLVLVDETARLRTPFTELGVPPEAASSLLFPARMGWQQAARLLYTSEWITADEAVELGIALRACPAGTVLAEAVALATKVASFPLESLLAIKKAMLDAQLPLVQRARSVEEQAFAEIFAARRAAADPAP
jgi:enoyl-CoA hydratase/carnithine racemase